LTAFGGPVEGLPTANRPVKGKNLMSQRTWFITGISSGFGRHMTEQLLDRGDRVAGTARKLEAVDNLKK
jgi:NADP-dependent 3-hydroxy acid dehydrogenase YdfG